MKARIAVTPMHTKEKFAKMSLYSIHYIFFTNIKIGIWAKSGMDKSHAFC